MSPKNYLKQSKLDKINLTDDQLQKWQNYLTNIQKAYDKKESEEHQKNIFNEFLKDCFGYSVNTNGKQDNVIYDADGKPQVIIEFKALANKSEMSTLQEINHKTLQQLLYYYLQETRENKSVKHLIITNGKNFLIWDGTDFETIFGTDKKLKDDFLDFENKKSIYNTTDKFYKNIAFEAIERKLDKILETVVVLDTHNEMDNQNLPKCLAPEYLLKQTPANINSLNREFYNELLYIMGLEEKTQNGIIKIVRLENKRQNGSLLENVLLRTEDFEIGFEIIVTWINRILFLKLLEGQIIDYNQEKPEFAFLTVDKITKYKDLKRLFFDVLAVENRNPVLAKGFETVPYLNSSLFLETDLEKEFGLQQLDDDYEIQIFPQTVLKDHLGNKKSGNIKGLEYLLEFLKSYNFSSVKKHEDNNKLINSSVLGSFFEKLNGYKDGSFYTPSSITEYMSATSLKKLILQKFGDKKILGNSIKELRQEIKIQIREKNLTVADANQIIDNLKIVDPAVGSGYFLVSCLNQILYFKSRLGLLLDKKGEFLDCDLELENDELKIYQNGKEYRYYPNLVSNSIVQESLFLEKQKIIENCLFGVDINPSSVKICQLRLWIELLKNTYYKQDQKLQTLPNIDINIKCGNSLLSRFETTQNLAKMLKNTDFTVQSFQKLFTDYHTAKTKIDRKIVEQKITSIKAGFKTYLSENSPISYKIRELQTKIDQEYKIIGEELFEISDKIKKERQVEISKLNQEMEKLETERQNILTGKIYQNAFEWRFEFPQVLAGNGDFVGFDLVIGNPPYIQLQANGGQLGKIYEKQNWQTFAKTGDIYALFYEQSHRLIANGGYSCLITSNKWLRAGYGENLRKYILGKTNLVNLYDVGSGVFENATVDTNILLFQKNFSDNPKTNSTQICAYKKDKLSPQTLSNYWQQNAVQINPNQVFDITGKGGWFIGSPSEFQLKKKIESVGKPLKDWDVKINYGIKTGLNEAFIIDENKKNELIAKDPKSAEIIKPILRGRDIKRYGYEYAGLYLINSHNGYKTEIPLVRGGNEVDGVFLLIDINDYPAIKEHLDSFEPALSKRSDKGKTPYNLRNCAYLDEFEKEKVVYSEITQSSCFAYDKNGEFFVSNTGYLLTGERLKFLTAVLNSKLTNFAYKKFYCTTLGENGIRWLAQHVCEIPIPILDTPQKCEIAGQIEVLVEEILELKKEISTTDTQSLENQIDELVFGLYGLTAGEIGVVLN